VTDVAAHYAGGDDLTAQVLAALAAAGHDVDHLEPSALATFEDFHTGSRATTERLATLAGITGAERVLDVGCGLGGPARYLAGLGCTVTGVDLTPELLELGRELTARTGLTDRVDLQEGDGTDLPFADASFDVAWTQHVAMNIADKPRLYGEMRRVLVNGGRLAFFDVVEGDGAPIDLPVPWATTADHSHLVTADRLRGIVEAAGFAARVWDDPTDALVPGFRKAVDAIASGTGPALSLALYVRDAPTKMRNYMRNMEDGRTRLLFAVADAV
jgi:SAM-dependent methyltransferase